MVKNTIYCTSNEQDIYSCPGPYPEKEYTWFSSVVDNLEILRLNPIKIPRKE
jgi:hypothetical protein